MLDISNPASPVLIGSHPRSGYGHGIDSSGSAVVVAEGPMGISVFEIVECEAFFFDGFESGDTSPWSVTVP